MTVSRSRRFSSRTARERRTKILGHLALILLSAVFMMPLVWAVTTSLKSLDQVFAIPPQWIPHPAEWGNYIRLFEVAPFARFFLNSLVLVLFNVLGQVLAVSLVAFGFSRLRFPGRNVLFILMLSTLMLPYYVTLIPTFVLFNFFGWIDTYLPLIVPAFTGSSFLIFLVRQYMMTLPLQLDDAARIDGCNNLQLYWHVILPLSAPALTVVVVFTVVDVWNDFFGPLIYLSDTQNYTLSLGLVLLQGQRETDWPLLMAATVISIIPLLILYFFAQKQLIGGIASVGIKG
ncbi:MAG: carbohydrate ABC transporter permease [Trueperaceae bacterium]